MHGVHRKGSGRLDREAHAEGDEFGCPARSDGRDREEGAMGAVFFDISMSLDRVLK
jgi:hypothetical protein